MRRARVLCVIDAVTEARDLLLLRQHIFYVLDRIEAGFVDGEEHAHHRFIRAAVERTLEGADGSGDSGVYVGKGGGDDAGGEGGGVQLVVGMEDEGDVEGARRSFRRFLPGEHPEEV